MKRIKSWMLVLLGTVVGGVYVGACGGTSAIADVIGQAMDVIYDNTASSLSATNMQESVDEVVARLKILEESAAAGISDADLVGTWRGNCLNSHGTVANVSIAFNSDGTYLCSCGLSEGCPMECTDSSKGRATWERESGDLLILSILYPNYTTPAVYPAFIRKTGDSNITIIWREMAHTAKLSKSAE